jgi:hypothetical protein
MPYKENDALDDKAFKILLKRGALETPKPRANKSTTRKNVTPKRPQDKSKSKQTPSQKKNKSRKSNSNNGHRRSPSKDKTKEWFEIGQNEGENALLLLNAANENVYKHQKLKWRVESYENEVMMYLRHIDRLIQSLPRNDTNFLKIEEYDYPKPRANGSESRRKVKRVDYFMRKESLAPLFRNVNIRGDGNCLFNTFAWWIITYFSVTNASFDAMDEHLRRIIPKTPRIDPAVAAKGSHIEKVAELLRSMVCGFYTKYEIVEKDLRETDLKLVSLADLNVQISGLEPDHREIICRNAEWGTDVDARVMAYILKVNIVFVLTNEYGGLHYYSAEYGELGRPVFYIFKSTGHYDVLYPASDVLSRSIAPLPIAK